MWQHVFLNWQQSLTEYQEITDYVRLRAEQDERREQRFTEKQLYKQG